MPTLSTTVDPRSSSYQDNRQAMLARLDELDEALAAARTGDAEPRRWIELLLDRDAPFLELCAVAGTGLLGGIGPVEGVECVLVATVPGAAGGAYAARKMRRLGEIAAQDRLPLIHLIDGGPGLATPAGTEQSPTIAVMLGAATGSAAYLPALSDYTIFVRGRGGQGGLADFLAEDERDAIRLARLCVRRLDWYKAGRTPRGYGEPPKYEIDDLLGIGPLEPREILARVLDGSEFDEFKPRYGTSHLTGWGQLYGYPVGVLADGIGAPGPDEVARAAQFVQLANASRTPLLFLRGAAGMPSDPRLGATLIQALAGSTVPHLVVHLTATAADPAPAGQPRFRFSWPALDAEPYDGVIDPRDTRTALGIALSAVHSGPIKGAVGYGAVRR